MLKWKFNVKASAIKYRSICLINLFNWNQKSVLEENILQIGASCYKLGKLHYYKLGKCCYKLGQQKQISATVITK